MGSTLDFSDVDTTSMDGGVPNVNLSVTAGIGAPETDSYDKTTSISINVSHYRGYIVIIEVPYSLSCDPNGDTSASLTARIIAGGQSGAQSAGAATGESKSGTLRALYVIPQNASTLKVQISAEVSAHAAAGASSASVSTTMNGKRLSLQAVSRGISPKGAAWIATSGKGVVIDREAGSVGVKNGNHEAHFEMSSSGTLQIKDAGGNVVWNKSGF
jgi:hypothetical protein